MCEFCGCGLGKAVRLTVTKRETSKALKGIPIVASAVTCKDRLSKQPGHTPRGSRPPDPTQVSRTGREKN